MRDRRARPVAGQQTGHDKRRKSSMLRTDGRCITNKRKKTKFFRRRRRTTEIVRSLKLLGSMIPYAKS